MKKFKSLSPTRLLVLVLFTFSSLAVSSAQTVATAGGQVTEFDVNGLKVLVKRRAGTPTVAAGMFIRGGVRNMTAANAGIENFMLNAAVEGSKAFPTERLRKETSRSGTMLSASSGYDYSVISLACTKPNFDISWQIFSDVIVNPTFAPADVERVRDGILSGLRSANDSPEGALELLTEKMVYAGHPYSVDPRGDIDVITKLKPADLAAYHKGLLRTTQMLLVLVGDVEPDVVKKKVEAAFGTLAKGAFKAEPLPKFSFTAPALQITPRSVQTDYVQGTFAAPSIGDPDYYAMRSAMTILQQRVFQEVRVRRNLSYAPDAELDERGAATGSISVTSVNPTESVRIMLGEINKLKTEAVDQDAIGQMSGFFLTTYYMKEETNAAQAAELAQYELIGGGWRNSLDFLPRIRKVKPADIQAVANKYMKNLQFAVVGNAADVTRSVFLQQ